MVLSPSRGMAGPLDIRNVAQRSGKIGARRLEPVPVQLRHHPRAKRLGICTSAVKPRTRRQAAEDGISPSTLIIHVDLEVEAGQ